MQLVSERVGRSVMLRLGLVVCNVCLLLLSINRYESLCMSVCAACSLSVCLSVCLSVWTRVSHFLCSSVHCHRCCLSSIQPNIVDKADLLYLIQPAWFSHVILKQQYVSTRAQHSGRRLCLGCTTAQTSKKYNVTDRACRRAAFIDFTTRDLRAT